MFLISNGAFHSVSLISMDTKHIYLRKQIQTSKSNVKRKQNFSWVDLVYLWCTVLKVCVCIWSYWFFICWHNFGLTLHFLNIFAWFCLHRQLWRFSMGLSAVTNLCASLDLWSVQRHLSTMFDLCFRANIFVLAHNGQF